MTATSGSADGRHQAIDGVRWHDGVAVQQQDVDASAGANADVVGRRKAAFVCERMTRTPARLSASSALPSRDALSTTITSCDIAGGCCRRSRGQFADPLARCN